MSKFNFSSKAEWWFGTDLMDLHRSFTANSTQKNSLGLFKILTKFKSVINDMQLNIDKKKMLS